MADESLILLTTLGGLAMVATVILPGQSKGWRVLSAALGAVVLVWMGWVLVTGGTYGLTPYFAFVPLLLVGQSIRTMLRARRAEADASAHPAEGSTERWHHTDERPSPHDPHNPHSRTEPRGGTPGPERPDPHPQ